MSHRKSLKRSIQSVLAVGVTASMGMPAAVAQDMPEDQAELDRVQVTGSRIQRTDMEGALPVTTIDREQIELSGESNAADLIRNLSFNSAGSFRPQSGSSAQSWAGVDMRGLGEGRTLILIDGRRAPVAPNVGSAQDLNNIPMAAIERIEVLSDGASAVYGSDAIGGVINVITRSDFEGFEIMAGISDTEREGGETEEFSAVMGISSERGSLMAGVSMNQRDIIWQRDREWSAGGASIFSNNFDGLNHPEFGQVVPGDGCTGEGFFTGPSGEDDIPTCFYDFTLQAADEAEITNKSIFLRGNYDITFDWSAYFNAQVNRVESFGRYAPVPSSPWPGGLPTMQPGDPNHPATSEDDDGNNPYWDDPYYQQYADDPVQVPHRFAALGPRDTEIDSHVYDIDMGLDGQAGDFDIQAGMRYTESKYIDLGYNYVVGELAQGFIDSGEYNIYDPFDVEEDIANQMITTISRNSVYKQNEIYANAATDIGELPAGPIGFAFGGEYREERYQDQYDSLSEGGQVVGSAGNSAGGGREVGAAFFETMFPLTDELEMTLAGRYDDYSDYGSDFSPKISFRYQPIQELTLRASYGEGFRAPTLDILTQQPAFSAASVTHGPTALDMGQEAGDSIQITSYSIANPDLDSEQSEQFSIGAAFQPTEWLSGSVDYFDIEITNQVSFIGAQTVLNCLAGTASACPAGIRGDLPDVEPPVVEEGIGARFEGDGTVENDPVDYIQTGYSNLGTLETSGFDFNLAANFEVGPGRLRHNLQGTYVTEFRVDGGDNSAGNAGRPNLRATLENVYSWSDFSVAWNINFVDGQDTSYTDGDEGHIPSWATNDVQGNWYTPWDGRVTLGMRNVGDRMPPLDSGDPSGRGFNFGLYDAYGRQTYLRYTQNF